MTRSTTKRPARTATVGAAVLALVLSACGSGDEGSASSSSASSSSSSSTTTEAELPTAAELYAKARTTALAAKSAHVQGSMSDDGDTVTIDLAGTTDGSNQAVELGQDGAELTIRTVGGKHYLSATEGFWTQQLGAAQAKALVGKFVVIPPDEVKDFGDMTLKSLLEEMFEDESMSGLESADARVERVTVDGTDAYQLSEKAGGDGAALVVSADGKATLLKVTGPKAEPGELRFSQWNEVEPVTAPAPSKVIEIPTK